MGAKERKGVMDVKQWIGRLLLSIYFCSAGYADHSPLLPRPQQIQYGTGGIAIRPMQIVFSAAPNAGDRFAAEELQSWIRNRTGLEVTIGSYGARVNGRLSVVLDREGTQDEPLAQPGDKPGPNSREAYDLSVTDRGVKIHARSSAGIFYGAQELRQLIEGAGAQAVLPVVEIHDWPSMAYRGTMVDISHGPLPTEKEIKRQIDFLARWKANQYYLYSEDSIELTGYPLLDAEARLTKEEVRRIVAYGRERHIDVIPNFDLYGHQHDLFRTEEYSDMSDQPHGTEFDPRNPKVLPLSADCSPFLWTGPNSFLITHS
jgi:hexosaminidase